MMRIITLVAIINIPLEVIPIRDEGASDGTNDGVDKGQ